MLTGPGGLHFFLKMDTGASIATSFLGVRNAVFLQMIYLQGSVGVLLCSMKFSAYIEMIQCSQRIYPQS